jgi:hypothetical protein
MHRNMYYCNAACELCRTFQPFQGRSSLDSGRSLKRAASFRQALTRIASSWRTSASRAGCRTPLATLPSAKQGCGRSVIASLSRVTMVLERVAHVCRAEAFTG